MVTATRAAEWHTWAAWTQGRDSCLPAGGSASGLLSPPQCPHTQPVFSKRALAVQPSRGERSAGHMSEHSRGRHGLQGQSVEARAPSLILNSCFSTQRWPTV